MDKLADGLQKLASKVKGRQESVITQKSADWSVIHHEHPDIAGFITDFSVVFGKPGMVVVKNNAGDVLLDSRRYE